MHPDKASDGRRAASGRPWIVGAIPARYGSERLPGKALASIAGRPMIEHVWRRASAAEGLDRVVVLTDDERIARAVEGFGGDCEMTPAECASGTDRVAWAARRWPEVTAVVNIQGDEPLLEPAAIAELAAHLAQHPEDPLVTLAAPGELGDRDRPDVVKVVVDAGGYALYFSRAAIPYPRGEAPPPLRHIGIYGYQREALLRLAGLARTPLELAESLEQLRALEHGIPIRVRRVAHAWRGVDTIEDLTEVDRLLTERIEAGAG